MQKIIPHLWFDSQAEEAAQHYCAVFDDSRILHIARYPESAEEVSGKKAGSVMTVSFEIEGQSFVALNGGPVFQFSPAISFLVNCETQEEVDRLWNHLSAKPEAEQCGWLEDKFGVSWQIVPRILSDLITNGEPGKVDRMTAAMLQMKKLDIEKLQAAYES